MFDAAECGLGGILLWKQDGQVIFWLSTQLLLDFSWNSKSINSFKRSWVRFTVIKFKLMVSFMRGIKINPVGLSFVHCLEE